MYNPLQDLASLSPNPLPVPELRDLLMSPLHELDRWWRTRVDGAWDEGAGADAGTAERPHRVARFRPNSPRGRTRGGWSIGEQMGHCQIAAVFA